MLKFISDEQVAQALSYAAVTASIEKAFESLAHGRAAIKAAHTWKPWRRPCPLNKWLWWTWPIWLLPLWCGRS